MKKLGKMVWSVDVRRFWQYIACFLLIHFQCLSAFSPYYRQSCQSHNSQRKDGFKIKHAFPFHISATSDSNSSQEKRRQSLVVGNDPLLSLNMNLDALARAQAAERAQELYQRIAALHREGYYAVSPDVVSFNSVIKAWQSDPSRALEFWEQEVDQLAPKDKPNTRSFNTFLLSLANAGLYKSAEELLEQMKNSESVVVPDRITYNTVLLSYLLSAEGSIAADRAEMLLKEMLSGENDLSLASIHYCRPDIISFNTVIATWANHPNPEVAVAKVEEWLQFVKSYSGVKPDIYTYTTVLHAWARYGRTRREKPRTKTENRTTYDDSSAERIREIFQEIDNAGLVPNRVTYTVAMQELALNANGGPETARELLREMLAKCDAHPEARPDVVTFSVLIDAYSDLASEFPEESIQSCTKIFSEMKQLAKKWPDVAPNERTYTSMISVLAQSRTREAGPLAEKLLQDMWNTPELTPSSYHYNACINVYAKSSRVDKAIRAERIWQDMKAKGIAEGTITCNTLLAVTSGVFGSSNVKKSGLKLGIKVFQSLQENPECIPNTLSYFYWFKTIRRLMEHNHPLRDSVVRQAFDLCCQQGCLNDTLLQYLITHFDSMCELLEPFIQVEGKQGQKDPFTIECLPREWSKNAWESRSQVEW